MIRNLKVLMLAALAVAAFGAFSASGALAAEYHCNVETGKSCTGTLFQDGSTGKEKHHVFIIKKGAVSASVTCAGLLAQGTMAKTASQLTVTNLDYNSTETGCTLAGSPAKIDTEGCDYLFTANEGKVHVVCEAGKVIQITSGACTVTIGSQTLSGITYTNINSKKEVTVTTNVKNVDGFAHEGCTGLLGFSGTFTEGEYSTGNTIVKGYKDGSEHTAGNQVSIWWE